MTYSRESNQHLFIVRIWREQGEPTPHSWRGSIDHVGSQERGYFTDLEHVQEFILERLAAASGPGAGAQHPDD